MKPSTLKARLGFGTLLALLLLLLLTGFALDKAVRSSLLAAEQVRLERYFYLLFSLAEMSGRTTTATRVTARARPGAAHLWPRGLRFSHRRLASMALGFKYAD